MIIRTKDDIVLHINKHNLRVTKNVWISLSEGKDTRITIVMNLWQSATDAEIAEYKVLPIIVVTCDR